MVAGASTVSLLAGMELCCIFKCGLPLTFVFQGRGWGHGVGLSQWGAKAMQNKVQISVNTDSLLSWD